MSTMSEMDTTIEELRAAANALLSAADSLQRFFSRDNDKAEAPQDPKPLTLESVRDILRRKCEEGFATEVREMIESLGAKSLKDVHPDDYGPLVEAAQMLERGGGEDA